MTPDSFALVLTEVNKTAKAIDAVLISRETEIWYAVRDALAITVGVPFELIHSDMSLVEDLGLDSLGFGELFSRLDEHFMITMRLDRLHDLAVRLANTSEDGRLTTEALSALRLLLADFTHGRSLEGSLVSDIPDFLTAGALKRLIAWELADSRRKGC